MLRPRAGYVGAKVDDRSLTHAAGARLGLEGRTGAIWQATEDGLVTGAVLDEDASW